MKPFSTRRLVLILRAGNEVTEALSTSPEGPMIRYLEAAYLDESRATSNLVQSLKDYYSDQTKSRPSILVRIQLLLLRPSRSSSEILFFKHRDTGVLEAPESIVPYSSLLSIPHRDLKTLEGHILEETFQRQVDIEGRNPLIIGEDLGSELVRASRRRTKSKAHVWTWVLELSKEFPENISLNRNSLLTPHWMTERKFISALSNPAYLVSNHVRLLAGLIWNKNLPLILPPETEGILKAS